MRPVRDDGMRKKCHPLIGFPFTLTRGPNISSGPRGHSLRDGESYKIECGTERKEMIFCYRDITKAYLAIEIRCRQVTAYEA